LDDVTLWRALTRNGAFEVTECFGKYIPAVERLAVTAIATIDASSKKPEPSTGFAAGQQTPGVYRNEITVVSVLLIVVSCCTQTAVGD
jgi:hypothetical protein